MQKLEDVFLVSDGILVQFGDGTSCYFSASFLLEHACDRSNQIFMNSDPSVASEEGISVPPLLQSSGDGRRNLLQ